MKILILFLLSITLISCKNKSHEEQKGKQLYINIDNSTPIKLIKDIWRYSILSDTLSSSKDSSAIYYTMYSRGFMDDFTKGRPYGNAAFSKHIESEELNPLIDSRILKTEDSTDNKITIYTKEVYKKDKDEYSYHCYKFIKEKGKWLIDELLLKCLRCNGTGKINDSEEGKCIICNSSGWISLRYFRQYYHGSID